MKSTNKNLKRTSNSNLYYDICDLVGKRKKTAQGFNESKLSSLQTEPNEGVQIQGFKSDTKPEAKQLIQNNGCIIKKSDEVIDISIGKLLLLRQLGGAYTRESINLLDMKRKYNWKSITNQYSMYTDSKITSMACYPNGPYFFRGFSNGDLGVDLMNIDSTKNTSLKFKSCHIPQNYIGDYISQLDCTKDNLLVSGDYNAGIIDLQGESMFNGIDKPEDEGASPIKQAKFCPDNQNIISLTSQNGTIRIFDIRYRCDTPSINIRYAHRIGRKKESHCLTSFEWINSSSFVTASSANSELKIWDIKYPIGNAAMKSTAITTDTPTTSRPYGVTSLQYDTRSGFIWALSKNGILYGYSGVASEREKPLTQLWNEKLKVSSFDQKCSIQKGESFIACSSSNGIFTFHLPTNRDQYIYQTHGDRDRRGTIESDLIPTPEYLRDSSITSLGWHSHGEIVASYYNRVGSTVVYSSIEY